VIASFLIMRLVVGRLEPGPEMRRIGGEASRIHRVGHTEENSLSVSLLSRLEYGQRRLRYRTASRRPSKTLRISRTPPGKLPGSTAGETPAATAPCPVHPGLREKPLQTVIVDPSNLVKVNPLKSSLYVFL